MDYKRMGLGLGISIGLLFICGMISERGQANFYGAFMVRPQANLIGGLKVGTTGTYFDSSGNLYVAGTFNQSGALQTGGATRISSAGAGTLASLVTTGSIEAQDGDLKTSNTTRISEAGAATVASLAVGSGTAITKILTGTISFTDESTTTCTCTITGITASYNIVALPNTDYSGGAYLKSIVPGTGNVLVTFSADPGMAVTIPYIAWTQ